MEMKNLCGKIPLELHAKVRAELEQREISTQEFLQQVIEEHFMKKGVEQMAARTIAVQVTEELFGRLKAAVAWKGCKQKDFLLEIIEAGIAKVEEEQRHRQQEAETERIEPQAGEMEEGEGTVAEEEIESGEETEESAEPVQPEDTGGEME